MITLIKRLFKQPGRDTLKKDISCSPQDSASIHPLQEDEVVNFLKGKILAIVGMHRSGTSVVTGMLQDQGIFLSNVNVVNRYNMKGNRENKEIKNIHDEVLQFNNATWKNPPVKTIKFTYEHVSKRNEILQAYDRIPCAFKDPRTLILLDFWEDLDVRFIGVIRNPASVVKSLLHRSRKITQEEGFRLWKMYNENLLELRKRKEFPIINFDLKDQLEKQIGRALEFYHIEPKNSFSFYDPQITQNDVQQWRKCCNDKKIIQIWEYLSDMNARFIK